MSEKYDLVVVGGGPGGYVAAIRAAQLGLKSALVEREELGGVCLNRGCIPTKALLASSQLLSAAKEAGEFGVRIEGIAADLPAMYERKDRVVKRLTDGVSKLLDKRGVDVLVGEGSIVSSDTVVVTRDEGEVELRTSSVILATGSKPIVPRDFPHDGRVVMTTRDILSSTDLPRSLLVIGAGAVGCEFAGFYAALGSDVMLVEMLPGLLEGEDKSATRQLAAALKKQGVAVRVGTRVEALSIKGERAVAVLSDGGELQVDRVLLAMGRSPSVEESGIAEAGIRVENGAVAVNDRMETSVPGVYAIGDLVGGWLLAHVASREGVVAAARAAGLEARVNYRAIPRCTFTVPEIASVGMTEAEARDSEVPLKVGRFPFSASGKAVAGGHARGFVKITCEEASGKVVGGVIVGPHASELIHEITLAVEAELSYERIANMIHAHPTLSEAVMETAESVGGISIHSM